MRADYQRFFDAMVQERQHQADRFGGGDVANLDAEDDKRNNASDWVAYIAKYMSGWLPGTLPPWDRAALEAFKTSMVKAATLALSAHSWCERRLASLQPVVGDEKVGDPAATRMENPHAEG